MGPARAPTAEAAITVWFGGHRSCGGPTAWLSKLIGPDELAAKAVEMMERYSITTLVVADNAKRIVGVVHLHDLLKHGIV